MVTNALRHRYLSSIWIKPHRARCPFHKWQPIINYAAFSVVQMTKSSHTRHLMRIPKGWLLRQIYDTTIKIQLKVEHFSYPTSMQQPPITQIAFRIHVFLQTHQNQYPPGPVLRWRRVFCTPEETPLRQWAVALGPAKRFTENIMICISSTGGEPSNGWQFYIAMLLKEEKIKWKQFPMAPVGCVTTTVGAYRGWKRPEAYADAVWSGQSGNKKPDVFVGKLHMQRARSYEY